MLDFVCGRSLEHDQDENVHACLAEHPRGYTWQGSSKDLCMLVFALKQVKGQSQPSRREVQTNVIKWTRWTVRATKSLGPQWLDFASRNGVLSAMH